VLALCGRQSKATTWTREQRLAFAVLEEAVRMIKNPARSVCGYHLTKRTNGNQHRLDSAVDDAWAWIRSDATDWPFTFVNICDYLSLEPPAVRRWIAQTLATGRRWRTDKAGRSQGTARLRVA
jgi:hypothetical protein